MTEPSEAIMRVSENELVTTWRTLAAVAHNYEWGSPGNLCLIEACRLIEVEIRVQHGDHIWATLRA